MSFVLNMLQGNPTDANYDPIPQPMLELTGGSSVKGSLKFSNWKQPPPPRVVQRYTNIYFESYF